MLINEIENYKHSGYEEILSKDPEYVMMKFLASKSREHGSGAGHILSPKENQIDAIPEGEYKTSVRFKKSKGGGSFDVTIKKKSNGQYRFDYGYRGRKTLPDLRFNKDEITDSGIDQIKRLNKIVGIIKDAANEIEGSANGNTHENANGEHQ
jgi:hypothetical protein